MLSKVTEMGMGKEVHKQLACCTGHFPLQRSVPFVAVAFARATMIVRGLVLASVVVMPPWPNGRMFPPRMKIGVLSVTSA